jgi:hypothetical protein
MKKSAKPTTATKPTTKPTTAKGAAEKAAKAEAPKTVTGTLKYNKDTKRFHAYDIKGGTFNGALYFEKDGDIPKTITLTIVS